MAQVDSKGKVTQFYEVAVCKQPPKALTYQAN